MNLVTGLLTDLAENAGKSAAPFVLGELPALLTFTADVAKAEFDFSISPEERAFIKTAAIEDLETFLTACENEGIAILTDLPKIFIAAGATDMLSAFGFNKTTATIASQPSPYS